MIGVPQCLARDALEPPAIEKLQSVSPARALQIQISRAGVDAANRADALVASENLLTQVACVSTKTPLVDTPVRAECEAPLRHFEVAPAAQRAPARAFLQSGSIHVAAGHGAGSTHNRYRINHVEVRMNNGSRRGFLRAGALTTVVLPRMAFA